MHRFCYQAFDLETGSASRGHDTAAGPGGQTAGTHRGPMLSIVTSTGWGSPHLVQNGWANYVLLVTDLYQPIHLIGQNQSCG